MCCVDENNKNLKSVWRSRAQGLLYWERQWVNECNFSMWFVLFVGVLWAQACENVQHWKMRYVAKATRNSWNDGGLTKTGCDEPVMSPARSRKAIGRKPDALWTKIIITNLYAKDHLRCPYVVAADISCWARSDAIPHTCGASDPTSSDFLTSQSHLSNTYYKGRTTRWRLSRFISNWQPCSLIKPEILSKMFLLFAFLKLRLISESLESILVRHQWRDKRKQERTVFSLKGHTSR